MPAPEVAEIVRQTADAIAALPNSEIERLVSRIPAQYLQDAQRRHILSNLLSRKARLGEILGTH